MSVVSSNLPKRRVFISYVREDSRIVDWVAGLIRRNGIEVFLDRDDLAPGKDFDIEIANEIESGLRFISIHSKARLAREFTYANDELYQAIEQLRLRPQNSGWFIPVRIDDEKIPDAKIGGGRKISHIGYCDLHRHPQGIKSLLQSLGVVDPDIGPINPLAIGYPDFLEIEKGEVRIISGLRVGADGMRFSVDEGNLFRRGDEIVLRVSLLAPFLSYFAEHPDIGKYELICRDKNISVSQGSPSIFAETKSVSLPAGAQVPDGKGGFGQLQIDVNMKLSVQLELWLSDQILLGDFATVETSELFRTAQTQRGEVTFNIRSATRLPARD